MVLVPDTVAGYLRSPFPPRALVECVMKRFDVRKFDETPRNPHLLTEVLAECYAVGVRVKCDECLSKAMRCSKTSKENAERGMRRGMSLDEQAEERSQARCEIFWPFGRVEVEQRLGDKEVKDRFANTLLHCFTDDMYDEMRTTLSGALVPDMQPRWVQPVHLAKLFLLMLLEAHDDLRTVVYGKGGGTSSRSDSPPFTDGMCRDLVGGHPWSAQEMAAMLQAGTTSEELYQYIYDNFADDPSDNEMPTVVQHAPADGEVNAASQLRLLTEIEGLRSQLQAAVDKV